MDALVGLTNVPSELTSDKNLRTYSLPLTGADMVFFKPIRGFSGSIGTSGVRQAINVNQLILGLGYPVIPVREPLLIGQLVMIQPMTINQ